MENGHSSDCEIVTKRVAFLSLSCSAGTSLATQWSLGGIAHLTLAGSSSFSRARCHGDSPATERGQKKRHASRRVWADGASPDLIMVTSPNRGVRATFIHLKRPSIS